MNFKKWIMPRKKKNISVDIDTKNVDVKIERKDGELEASIDTPILDVEIEKKNDKLKVKVKADENIVKTFRNLRTKRSSYK
jgi:hypothetical protein